MNTQQALQLAFQHLNGGNFGAAGQLFNSILRQEPQNFAALNGRGFIALQQNLLPQAQLDLQASISVNPKQPFAHKMLGIVLGAQGQFDAAMQSFAGALALDAKDAEVYFNRANFRFQVGQVQEALSDLNAAIKLRGSYLEARSNRANLLIQLGNFAQAEKDLDYLLSKVINNPDLWVAHGLVSHKLGKYKEAMRSNERALQLTPNHADALLNGASTLLELENYPEAVSWIERAIKVVPENPAVFYTKGNIFLAQSNFEAAINEFDKAILLKPDYVQALNSRGLANSRLRNMALAIIDYDKAIEIDPEFHDAIYNKSYFQLEQGDFEAGWSGYEHRFNVPGFGLWRHDDFQKWEGQRLEGALLIRSEQGLGDQILFASVLPDIEKLTGSIVLLLEPRLVTLFQRSFPHLTIISTKDKMPRDIEAQTTLGSLPRFCRNSISDFKNAKTPFLIADVEQTEQYRQALNASGKMHIGLSWFSKTKLYSKHKSISLPDLLPLFLIEGIDFVDLQYGDMVREKAVAQEFGMAFNEAVQIDQTNDLDALASLISACDLIITVSNTTAHIAAALGKTVLLMLPYRIGKLWYWSDALSEGSIWYPSVKSFHQENPDDWQGTINQVADYLKKQVE